MKAGIDKIWNRGYNTVSIPVFGLFIFLITLGWPVSGTAQLSIGQGLPELTLADQGSQPVALQSFKGRMVLIDFWASWCAPCRKANRKLIKLYKDHQEDAFEIVGISLDVDRRKWLNAIDKDKLTYTQLTDPKGFEAQSVEIFGFEALPASFLFDKQGMLLAINPTESEIRSYLMQNKN